MDLICWQGVNLLEFILIMSSNTIVVMVTKMAINIELCSKESILFMLQSKQVHWPIKRKTPENISQSRYFNRNDWIFFFFCIFLYFDCINNLYSLSIYIQLSIDTDQILAICIFQSARALSDISCSKKFAIRLLIVSTI